MDDLNLILKALDFAAFKHKYQRRKGDKNLPYINHPIRVAYLISEIGGLDDPIIIASAILHDIIEDTETDLNELEERFGKKIASIVKEVSDNKLLDKKKRKELQIKNASSLSFEATVIRIADKIANIEDIASSPPSGWTLERKLDYLAWAEKVVSSCNNVNERLSSYFFEKLSKIKREIISHK